MKPEVQAGVLGENELRIKVAELCGWTRVRIWGCGKKHPKHPDDVYGDKGSRIGEVVPDYPNDLNAMHEAEKGAPIQYWKNLSEIVGYGGMSITWQNLRLIGHATARQRAEAFVKTMEGKSVQMSTENQPTDHVFKNQYDEHCTFCGVHMLHADKTPCVAPLPRPLEQEQDFFVDDQRYYRGNMSPRWYYRSERGGLSALVDPNAWPLLEEIAAHNTRLRAARENTIIEIARDKLATGFPSKLERICLERIDEADTRLRALQEELALVSKSRDDYAEGFQIQSTLHSKFSRLYERALTACKAKDEAGDMLLKSCEETENFICGKDAIIGDRRRRAIRCWLALQPDSSAKNKND